MTHITHHVNPRHAELVLADQRATFIDRFDTALHVAHGAVQREHVAVPPDLLGETDQLLPYFADSLAYALTLKPKPTRAR